MKKDTSPKKLFQPDDIGRFIVDGYPKYSGTSMSNFVTFAVKKAFEPKNKQLKAQYTTILAEVEKNYNKKVKIDDMVLRTVLADICGDLVYYEPCDVMYIEKLFSCYITTGKMEKNYFYDIELSNTDQDFMNQYRLYLNDLDRFFSPIKREFDYILKFMIKHWDKLKTMGESYRMLALIAQYGELKSLDEEYRFFSLIDAMDLLDGYLTNTNRGDFYKYELAEFLPDQKSIISLMLGEIGMYYTNNAYSYLTGDYGFKSIPNELRSLWSAYLDSKICKQNENQEEYMARIQRLRADFAYFFYRYEADLWEKRC